MSKQRPHTIAILDLATSGFRAKGSVILEVCCILVSADTLDILDTFHSLVRQKPDLKVPDFHAPLLAECVASDVSLARVEGLLLADPRITGAGAVCNRALDFDLGFTAAHMPLLHKQLPRMRIDLKVLEFLAVARGAQPYKDPTPRTYRAIDDAIAAYNELVHWTTNK